LASVFLASKEAFSSLTFLESSTILAAAVSADSEEEPKQSTINKVHVT